MRFIKFIFVSMLLVLMAWSTAYAQAPYGFAIETNEEQWFEICNSTTHDPLAPGFYPTTYLGIYDLHRDVQDINEFAGLYRVALPQPFIDEGIGAYSSSPMLDDLCFWEAHVDPKAIPGDTYETAYTPWYDFSHNNVEYGDVSFGYYFSDSASGGALWRPYKIWVRWDDDLETLIRGTIDHQSNGYISKFINPRSGHYVTSVRVEFPTIEMDSIADWLLYIPMPKLLVDRVLIRGFYRTSGLSTSTPTPSRTPTITPTPTETTTPRPVWDTPTPTPTGIVTATKQFPVHYGAVPTRIPTVAWPDWPGSLDGAVSTPSWSFSLPALATPAPISPTVTLAPFDWTQPLTIYTPAAFAPATVAATATSTPTATVSDCGAFVAQLGTISSSDTSLDNLFVDITAEYGHTGTNPDSYAWALSVPPGCGYLAVTAMDHTPPALTASGLSHNMVWTDETGLYWVTSRVDSGPIIDHCAQSIEVRSGDPFSTHIEFYLCGNPTPTPIPTITPTPTRADIIGSMNYLSNQLQLETTLAQTPTTFTIAAAPAEYAPHVPRNIANVGYTIENMDSAAGLGFGITAWASLFGYVVSLPFQLVKMLYNIMQMLGPARLFIMWLLLIAPFVLWVKLFLFIKNLLISLINLLIKIIRFIGDLWDLVPGL